MQCISVVKGKANSIIDQQKCEGHEKCDRVVISKMEINYQISQRNKILPNDPVMSNWVNFNNNCSL